MSNEGPRPNASPASSVELLGLWQRKSTLGVAASFTAPVMTTFGVIQFPGSCDERDALAACERVGDARLVWHGETDLSDLDALVVPGGFSYGDYLRAGAIARFAPAMAAVSELACGGLPVLGICNGFQVLCEAGLLPGALLPNAGLRFVCRQVKVETVTAHGAWTAGLDPGEWLSMPVKHAWGRYFAPAAQLVELRERGQIAFRYAPGQNPNGSLDDIAGVTNEAGNILGLMPHPEHAVDPLTGSADGLRLFAAVAEAAAVATTAAA
jgi:phosphoribosylformylglycinamidine synthase I